MRNISLQSDSSDYSDSDSESDSDEQTIPQYIFLEEEEEVGTNNNQPPINREFPQDRRNLMPPRGNFPPAAINFHYYQMERPSTDFVPYPRLYQERNPSLQPPPPLPTLPAFPGNNPNHLTPPVSAPIAPAPPAPSPHQKMHRFSPIHIHPPRILNGIANLASAILNKIPQKENVIVVTV